IFFRRADHAHADGGNSPGLCGRLVHYAYRTQDHWPGGDIVMSGTMIGILLVVLSTTFDSLGEILLKKSRLEIPRQILWVASGIALFTVQMVLYTVALRFLDIGVAFGISSLSFVFVVFLSGYLLREVVTPIRWVGACLIVAGTLLIGANA